MKNDYRATDYSHCEYTTDIIQEDADQHPRCPVVRLFPMPKPKESTPAKEVTTLDLLTLRNEVREDLSDLRTDLSRQLEQLTHAVIQLAKIEPMIDNLKLDHINLRKDYSDLQKQNAELTRKVTVIETKMLMWVGASSLIINPIVVFAITKMLGG